MIKKFTSILFSKRKHSEEIQFQDLPVFETCCISNSNLVFTADQAIKAYIKEICKNKQEHSSDEAESYSVMNEPDWVEEKIQLVDIEEYFYLLEEDNYS